MLSNEQQNNNPCNGLFAINIIDIISLIIGIQNMQLNITAQDLDNQTHTILDEIHSHLRQQDKRLERMEHMLLAQGEINKE